MVYTLMNRETPLCNFQITGEGDLEYCKILETFSPLPFWCEPLSSWLENRSSAKHREHVNTLLEQCGGKTKTGFIALTHCLSVTDTLWVKSEKEDVTWKQLNLYENRFDETISKFSINGNGQIEVQKYTTSPELTTDGSYDKCWLNESDGIHLIKAGIFIRSGIKYNIPDLLPIYKEYQSEEAFRRMVIADCVTLNSDRHFGNFGFLVNNQTFERIKINPVFDLNMCFTPYAYDTFGFDDFDAYLKDRGPVLGSNYVTPAKALLSEDIVSDLKIVRDLELVVQDDDKFTKKRVEQMNMIKDVQIDRILGIERVFLF